MIMFNTQIIAILFLLNLFLYYFPVKDLLPAL
jgi:hypothetical protein